METGTKGFWKHTWEDRGEPFSVAAPNGQIRWRQKYVCTTCGAGVTAKRGGRVKTKDWAGSVKQCQDELVERLHKS